MTELTFLLELLLEHKLPKKTKDVVAARIRVVEEDLSNKLQTFPTVNRPAAPPVPITPFPTSIVHGAQQAPSTMALLAKDASSPPGLPQPLPPQAELPPAVANIAQTSATAIALAQRQEAIRIATSGKEEKGRTSPRKF